VNFDRKQPLYNISPFTFQKLLGDSENIAPNLVAYINGFSETALHLFQPRSREVLRMPFGRKSQTSELYIVPQPADKQPDAFNNRLRLRLSKLPGVRSVGLTSSLLTRSDCCMTLAQE
jgi:hypothetical protein